MKKILVVCAVFAVLLFAAGSANAATCLNDHKPSATLLIPYFQATFNQDGTILGTGAAALDTLVTIGNASSAPMIAHVSVWSERTELVLDFNIALTGFDIQSFSMASVLRGFLPQTPINQAHVSNVKDANQVTINGDVCQRNPSSIVYPTAGGFLRVKPSNAETANSLDNTLATAQYPSGPFQSSFLLQILDSLDGSTAKSVACGGPSGPITNPIHGYVTIDHVNYCTLANPNDPSYYSNDAIGMENNLWGDYIYTSGAGLNTIGFAAVNIEADFSLGDTSGSPTNLTPTVGCSTVAIPGVTNCVGRRTFYRRYVPPEPTDAAGIPALGCNSADWNTAGRTARAWDCGFNDQREPLGLKYAARWFDSAPNVTSFFDVWRGSSVPSSVNGGLADLLGFTVGKCNTSEPTVTLSFFDEDENGVLTGVCPSPCSAPTFNFPLETQRTPITSFSHPNWPAGWVSMSFFNSGGPVGGALDQAWVTYDFQGPAAFLSAGIEATALDQTACQPLQVPVAPAPNGVTFTNGFFPGVPVGTGP